MANGRQMVTEAERGQRNKTLNDNPFLNRGEGPRQDLSPADLSSVLKKTKNV